MILLRCMGLFGRRPGCRLRIRYYSSIASFKSLQLITKRINSSLIRLQPHLVPQRIIINPVIGNHQHGQIHINLLGDLKVTAFSRPIAEYQTAPWSLRPQERENLGIRRVHGDIRSIKLESGTWLAWIWISIAQKARHTMSGCCLRIKHNFL